MNGTDPNQRDSLQELVSRFASAWLGVSGNTASVDLSRFLPGPGDSLRASALRQLIRIDLEMRWRSGRPVSLEHYVESFPELGTARSIAPELIVAEFQVRQKHGDKPPLTSYQARFPAQFTEVEQIIRQQSLPLSGTSKVGTATDVIDPDPTDQHSTVGGGYRLITRIGQGMNGQVWKAEAPGGVEVAIKLIKWHVNRKLSQQELQAMELMKRLRHTYLMQIQAYWLHEDQLVIVSELADCSLNDRLEQCLEMQAGGDDGGVPRDELSRYLDEAAEALDYLHTESVLHRDIKPGNILLLKGHAKVADFGLARLLEGDQSMIKATCGGTPTYMAPETWHGKTCPQSDQYSLAVTYAELRLGRAPFPGTTLMELMRNHLEHTPDLTPLPAEEQAVLLKAMSKDPRGRFGTCTQFAEAIAQAIIASTTAATNRSGGRPSTTRRMLAASLALLGVILLVGLGLYLKPVPSSTAVTSNDIWLPAQFEADKGASVRSIGGQRLHDRIVRAFPDGTRVEFILIPKLPEEQRRPDDPDTYYIMQNKVWNGLFAKFLSTKAEIATAPADLKPDLPAFRVTVLDAQRFAKWLDAGCDLPTPEQWDKAAGRFDTHPRRGPFQEPWRPGEIAVGSEPMPVGTAPKDISPSGCRDMGGNGREWTREIADLVKRRWVDDQSVGPDVFVRLRGGSFRSPEPLTFENLDAAPDQHESSESDEDIGFRVVLEPN